MESEDDTVSNVPSYETDQTALLQALLRKASTRIEGKVTMKFPAIPALVEYFVPMIRSQWLGLGRRFSDADLVALRNMMLAKAEAAFVVSPFSEITVTSIADAAPKNTITWTLECRSMKLEERYERWARTQQPPLFGKHPDAKVMELARALGDVAESPVLDAGAGSGRNTLPLARLGLPTDAVEITPALVKALRKQLQKEKLKARVFHGDILDASLPLPRQHYRMIVLAEVVSHFRSVEELQRLFTLANQLLVEGGLLVFNSFVARDAYQPSELARQLSQLTWSCVFTADELARASSGSSFDMVSSEPAREYEQARLAASDWPPTGWFEAWSAGTGLFDLPLDRCPMQLRWLVYRKHLCSDV